MPRTGRAVIPGNQDRDVPVITLAHPGVFWGAEFTAIASRWAWLIWHDRQQTSGFVLLISSLFWQGKLRVS
jgi:hypothetical protein